MWRGGQVKASPNTGEALAICADGWGAAGGTRREACGSGAGRTPPLSPQPHSRPQTGPLPTPAQHLLWLLSLPRHLGPSSARLLVPTWRHPWQISGPHICPQPVALGLSHRWLPLATKPQAKGTHRTLSKSGMEQGREAGGLALPGRSHPLPSPATAPRPQTRGFGALGSVLPPTSPEATLSPFVSLVVLGMGALLCSLAV